MLATTSSQAIRDVIRLCGYSIAGARIGHTDSSAADRANARGALVRDHRADGLHSASTVREPEVFSASRDAHFSPCHGRAGVVVVSRESSRRPCRYVFEPETLTANYALVVANTALAQSNH